MFKLFEWIGSVIAIACLIEIASNPKQVVRDIQNGPVPNLTALDEALNNPKLPTKAQRKTESRKNKSQN